MLGDNIRYLRIKRGYSQDYIAEKLGYKSYTTIQKWESGISEPPVKKLKELSILLDADMDDMANKDLQYEDNVISPHYESIDNVEYVKNLIQSLGYTAYATASERFGNSFIVQKSDDDKSVLIRNSEIHDILSQIEKAKSDIVQQVIKEKFENHDYYVEPSETELLNKLFSTITDVNDAKEYLSLRNMDISSYSGTEKISDEAIINIAKIIAAEENKHSSDSDFSAPKAARNNYIDEPGEIEKTYEDLSSLKRPE